MCILANSFQSNSLGSIDTSADSNLKDSLFGPQPPELDKNLLTSDDLLVSFTLDDAPVCILLDL